MPVAVALTGLGLYVGCLFILASWIRSKWQDSQELSRKLIHIGCGFLLPLSYWFQIPQWIALTASLVATSLVIINHKMQLISLIEDVERKTYGTTFYCASISILIFFFWNVDPIAMLSGALVMALSDGLAGLIGRGIPSPTWMVEGQTKSLAGTATMLLSTATILITISFQAESELSLTSLILISSVITALEQYSLFGIDNLSVPIGTASLIALLNGTYSVS